MSGHSVWVWIASLGGLGRSPFASGTVATIIAGVPIARLFGFLPPRLALFLLIVLFLVGCYASGRAEKELDRQDAPEIVIDELIGYLVTMIGLPVTPKAFLLGFLAFRLFDIWKPWPIRLLDSKVKGGLGVVLDDVGAGVLAHVLVWLILRIRD